MKILTLLLLCLSSFLVASEPFRIKVTTSLAGTSSNTQFSLPLYPSETYNFTVNWGDSTAAQVITTSTSPTHTYAAAGTYTISITENTPTAGFPRIYFNNDGDRLKLVELVQWGGVHWSSFESAFSGCSNLLITGPDHATARTEAVSDFSLAWYGCQGLTSFPLINTSAGTNFNYTWAYCSGLTAFPPLNTANGTEFGVTWSGCAGLTSFPLIDTAKGTGFIDTWYGCSGLSSFPLLVTSSASTFRRAWGECSGLTSFPRINTAAGTDFTLAWIGCSGLTSFPPINTAAGTNFDTTWFGCSGLTSFPPLNTAAGTNFRQTWGGCSGLTSFPIINTAAGTIFNGTWFGCSGLTSFPHLNTAAGTNFNACWDGCSNLTSFPLINTAAGTNFYSTWSGCSGLTSFPLINTASGTDFSYAWASCRNLSDFPNLDLAHMTSGTYCFLGVALPTSTYTALLIDLANRNSNTNVQFHGGGSRFDSSAVAARATLTGTRTWSITDGGLAVPIITSPLAASVVQGGAFAYTITASDGPTAFGATSVPSPLAYNNGVIAGTAPATTGTHYIPISAANDNGTGNATLTLYVNAAGAPAITSAATAGGILGQALTYQITASGTPTSWNALGLPPGLARNTSTGVITGTPTHLGTTQVTMVATNAQGSGTATLTFSIRAPGGSSPGGSSGTGGGGGGCGLGSAAGLLAVLLGCLGMRSAVSRRRT